MPLCLVDHRSSGWTIILLTVLVPNIGLPELPRNARIPGLSEYQKSAFWRKSFFTRLRAGSEGEIAVENAFHPCWRRLGLIRARWPDNRWSYYLALGNARMGAGELDFRHADQCWLSNTKPIFGEPAVRHLRFGNAAFSWTMPYMLVLFMAGLHPQPQIKMIHRRQTKLAGMPDH